jgi:hypothetical protein
MVKRQSVALVSNSMLRVEHVNVILNDDNTKLYCLFLKSALAIFDSANVYLQKDEPVIHKLHSVLCSQLRDLLVRFVKPSVITSCSKLHNVDFDVCNNQLGDDDLFIGHETSEYINNYKTKLALTQFYSSVRQFYMEACRYMIKKFPYNDELLMHAAVANVEDRSNARFTSVLYFIKRFPFLISSADENRQAILDRVQTQFLNYQVDDLPVSVLSAARIDVAWHQLSLVKDASTRLPKYDILVLVIKGILTMYHSNADCERLFSTVRKNKTDFRASMTTKTLSSILTHKTMMSAQSQVCHSVRHSDELLKQAKSATYQALGSGQL